MILKLWRLRLELMILLDGWAVVLPSSTMRVVDGTAGVVVERVVSALSGFVVEEIP